MLNRLITLVLAGGCIGLSLALLYGKADRATPVAREVRTPPVAHPVPIDDQALLDRPIDRLDLSGVTLDTAIAELAGVTKTNIIQDWHALAAVGHSKDRRLSLHVRKVNLRQALTIALNNLAMDGGPLFSFYAEDGIVTITTIELSYRTRTEYFNVRSLIDEVERSAPDWEEISHALRNSNAFDLGPHPSEEMLDKITKLITDCVGGETWRDLGGNVGDLRSINGILVITQTPKNLRLIRQLLDGLHESLHAVDFPPIVQRAGDSPLSRDESAPGGQQPSTQMVTEFFNIRPLIEELCVRNGSRSSRDNKEVEALRAHVVEGIIQVLAAINSPNRETQLDWMDTHAHEVGDILAVTESPAKLRAIRRLLDDLYRSSNKEGHQPTTTSATPAN